MLRQVLDLRALPEAVCSWVHVDFIRGLLPNEVQKIEGEGGIGKGQPGLPESRTVTLRKESKVTRS